MQRIMDSFQPTTAAAISAAESNQSDAVVVQVPQGYDARINIRVVPGRDFQINPARLGCRPRQGASRRDAEPLDLPESLVAKFKAANKKIMGWLAQDAANARLFLAQPVEAMLKAGVDLTRAEQKTLNRAHRMVREAAVIAPGVNIENLGVTAHPTGRIGAVRPKPKAKDGRDSDCGCGSI